MGYPVVRRERFGATGIYGPTQWGAIRSQAEFPNHMIAVSKMLIECDQQDMTFPLINRMGIINGIYGHQDMTFRFV